MTEWKHIDDELPPLAKRVDVAGYNDNGRYWTRQAWRADRGGGGWEWRSDDDDYEWDKLEYWAPISPPPDSRRAAQVESSGAAA